MGNNDLDELYSFLKNYAGDDQFLNGLKKWAESGRRLTGKQCYALRNRIEQRKKNGAMPEPTPPKEKESEMQKNMNAMSEVIDIDSVPAETPAKKDTSNLDMIDEIVAKATSAAVTTVLRAADDKLRDLMARAEAMSKPRNVCMHVKVGETAMRELTTEAHALLPKMIVNARLGLNTLLVGPAGSGKTTLGAQVAEALGLPFGHLCLSAGVSETWIYGRQLPQGLVEGEFSKFYRNGGVFLLDEFDAADSNLLLSINTALANGHLFNPILGEKIARHKDFICIAAANTFGLGGNAQYTGRSRLDAATLDRFVVLNVEYNETLEEKLCPDKNLYKKLSKARKKLKEKGNAQVISTRAFDRIYKLVNAGYSESEALSTITAAWPQDLAKQIGLESEKSDMPF